MTSSSTPQTLGPGPKLHRHFGLEGFARASIRAYWLQEDQECFGFGAQGLSEGYASSSGLTEGVGIRAVAHAEDTEANAVELLCAGCDGATCLSDWV